LTQVNAADFSTLRRAGASNRRGDIARKPL